MTDLATWLITYGDVCALGALVGGLAVLLIGGALYNLRHR